MKQNQADLYLETYQVLDIEIGRLREMQRWQSSAAFKVFSLEFLFFSLPAPLPPAPPKERKKKNRERESVTFHNITWVLEISIFHKQLCDPFV
jgi:hypothetical protein